VVLKGSNLAQYTTIGRGLKRLIDGTIEVVPDLATIGFNSNNQLSVIGGIIPSFAFYNIKMVSTKSVFVNPGQTLTLANISGSGVVTTLWVALDGYYRTDALINIYVDGETTPSIKFDLNSTGLFYMYAGRFSTLHSEIEGSSPARKGSFVFHYPIPYSSSIKIDIVAPSSGGFNTFARVFYTSDVTYSWRLKSASKTWLDGVIVPAGSSYTLLDTQGKGHLLYTSMGFLASNTTPIQSSILFYRNGETTPSIASTSVEDWFLFSFGSIAGTGSTPYSFASCVDSTNNIYTFVLDLLGLCGGYKFDTSCKLVIDSSQATTNYNLVYLILYKLDF